MDPPMTTSMILETGAKAKTDFSRRKPSKKNSGVLTGKSEERCDSTGKVC